jgi:hypothetical protein
MKTRLIRTLNDYDRAHRTRKNYRIKHLEEIKAKNKVYRAVHQEEIRAKSKAYYVDHREEINAGRRAHYAIDPTFRARFNTGGRAARLLYQYGLSQADFDALLDRQGGVCAICKKVGWNGKGPYVDHDHATGKVRGLLCMKCNGALGMIEDDPKVARAMIDYIGIKE